VSLYSDRLREHLARYKRERLGVTENGAYVNNGVSYPHILPQDLYRLNIIETIRGEFWRYAENTGLANVRHKDFHHLNSSQAFAFNLLFPWTAAGAPPVLPETLGCGPRPIRTWAFEFMPDQAERTTCDLYGEFADGARLLVEVKLTEEHFGSLEPKDSHRDKMRDTYAPRLAGKVQPDGLKEADFFLHYQLFRNVSHLVPDRGDVLVLLLPRANLLTWQQAVSFRERYLVERAREAVRLVAAEDLVAALASQGTAGRHRLHTHLDLFCEKYLSLDAA
jgi:hypothetical protein